MKIIIAGGRDYSDYKKLCSVCDNVMRNLKKVEIVSGVAKGADSLGERYAKEHDIPIKQFPADWAEYGKAAGYRRNSDMADYADALIAFWDGTSRGTHHMIDLAKANKLKIRIIRY